MSGLIGNQMQWNPSKKGMYEVWYVTASHVQSQTGYWIRSTIKAATDGETYCQVWFATFDKQNADRTWAFHKKFPISLLAAETSPFKVRIGEHAEVRHDGARGKLSEGGHSAEWDLSWIPAHDVHYHIPKRMYDSENVTKVCSPNLNVALRGRIVVDGREIVFDGDPGDQTHVWGKKHVHEWAWSHCNGFEGNRTAAWEGLSVRLKRGGIVLPTLSIVALELDGEKLSFTELQDTLLTGATWKDRRYHVWARGLSAKLEAEFVSHEREMIATPYVDPDGDRLWCMNSCIADTTVKVWRRSLLGRWKEAATLRAPGRGHWEYGQRDPDPRVMRVHQSF